MKKKQRVTVTNIGTSSMFVILFGLCFTVLATLAIAAAYHDYRLSEELAEHTTAYYTACNLAEERLLASDELYKEADADGYVSFSIPVQEKQELLVELCFKEDESEYTIRKWQIVNTGSWNGDASLPVLQKEQ